MVSRILGAGLALAMVSAVGLGATAASASTTDDAASWITNAALDNLGLTLENDELAEALRASIEDAIAAGLISVAVEDVAADPDSITEDDLDDVLDEELEEQENSWKDSREQWHTAFEQIHADFAECREAAEGGSDTCAHEFRYAMQVNNISAWLAHHEARLARTSSDDEKTKTSAKLDDFYERGMARLEKAAAHLEGKTGEIVESDIKRATEDESDDIEKPDKADKPDKAENPAKPDKADKADKSAKHGNHGGNGKADSHR